MRLPLCNLLDAYEDYRAEVMARGPGGAAAKRMWQKVEDWWQCVTEGEAAYFDHYAKCRQEGSSPRLADMLAARQAPSAFTDREFLRGHGANGAQFADCPDQGDALKAVAESHGQSVKGKVYLGGLARFPGDPLAWVDGRGDVQRVAEQQGLNVEGDVKVKSFTPPRRPPARKRKPLRLPTPDAATAAILATEPEKLFKPSKGD